MGNYGVSGAFMSGLLLILVSFFFVFVPSHSQIQMFILSTMWCMFFCHISANRLQGRLRFVMNSVVPLPVAV